MGVVMPSLRTVSQLAGVRRRRSPTMLAAFLLLLNGSPTLGMRIAQVTLYFGSLEIYAYNGEEFVHFDCNTAKAVAVNPLVQPYLDILNKNRKNMSQVIHVLEVVAPRIRNAIRALTTKPTITITSRHMKNRENTLALTCQVHGFYPKDIHVMWLRNGEGIDREVLNTSILPNRDGTFQVRQQVNIDPGKGDTYTCEIKHLSVPGKLHAVWVPKNTKPVYGYVIGVIAGIIGILMAVSGGIVKWKEVCSQSGVHRLQEEIGELPGLASECTTEA
ncbi:class II histocompatibility antigen, B-L beta chain-like [Mobula hypostoma]|uniref:class II histocompatibility antigen, B-L beta chain-like n=1 Tax=Mobula hypostoma TaxID=723540 RepID=UPI002FC2874C